MFLFIRPPACSIGSRGSQSIVTDKNLLGIDYVRGLDLLRCLLRLYHLLRSFSFGISRLPRARHRIHTVIVFIRPSSFRALSPRIFTARDFFTSLSQPRSFVRSSTCLQWMLEYVFTMDVRRLHYSFNLEGLIVLDSFVCCLCQSILYGKVCLLLPINSTLCLHVYDVILFTYYM